MSVWRELAEGVGSEFTDLSVGGAGRLAVRLLVAGLLGGLLGWERHKAGKAAGLRTHALVALGAAGFVAVPDMAGAGPDDASRVIQGVVAGIGFLGAGCILKRDDEGEVLGLTTAAGVWLTAAVGVAAGLGREASAVLLGAVGWFTLSALGRLEARISPRPATELAPPAAPGPSSPAGPKTPDPPKGA